MRATREESPSTSGFARIWSEFLNRYVHTHSEPERKVLYILLYCAWLFELQEQRMLPFMPAPHPLDGHPLAADLELPQFRGTLAVAHELNHFSFHPIVTESVSKEQRRDHPGCFIGDLLAFFKDQDGPFCVNLNVKETRGEFKVPRVGVTVRTDMEQATARNTARHEIEKKLYAEVKIPTIEVATDEISDILAANLRELLLWSKRKHSLTHDQAQIVLDALNDGLERGASALEVIVAVELSERISSYDQKIVMYQGIWHRKLRIDLFDSHFFIEKPMRAEQQDILEVYGHWFRRAA